ncbi:MAG: GNAT family N-acetyltransferase [Streptosporangiaceae bacterium]
MTDWQSEVGAWWAERLGLPPAALRSGGIYVVPGSGHVGVMALRGAARPLGYGPARALPALRRVISGSPGLLQAQDDFLPGGPLVAVAARVSAALGARAGAVIGPAWYGYTTAASLIPQRSPAVRALSPADLPLLARLHEQTPPAERDESGTTGLPAFGYFGEDALLSVACLGVWHEMPTLGVLTHPRHRGRGLARLVVTAAAQAGLDRRAVVQYRAWRANTASIAVARRTGFAHYCDGLVIDLDDPPG